MQQLYPVSGSSARRPRVPSSDPGASDRPIGTPPTLIYTRPAMQMLPSIWNRPGTGARSQDQSGQALVEAAFILPAMIFMLLCAIQVAQLQQARMMVEYAAFAAARVGIVHDMDNGTRPGGENGPMHDAAVLAVLPTIGRTDSFISIAKTLAKFKLVDEPVLAVLGLDPIRVAILNPHRADFAAFGRHLNQREIDFDDMRPAVAPTTLLSVQVRYLYQMNVPFANRMIQAIWFASKVGFFGHTDLESWQGADLTGPKVASQRGPDAVEVAQVRALGAGRLQDGIPGGLNIPAMALLAQTNHYYLPVDAWYTMRMQSNPFLKWAAP